MTRRTFLVQTRFDAERRWRTFDRRYALTTALELAQRLVKTKTDDWVMFPHVRLVFRGQTLALWKDGWFVR